MNLKKIIIYIVLVIVLVGVGFMAYLMLTTRSHSPADRMEFSDGDFQLSIDYCRPFKKDRLIFGDESENALLVYGKYWRTGANEATEIEFNKPVSINGQNVVSGRYRLYTIPDKTEWTVALNSEIGKWGYGEPDYDLDVLVTKVPASQSSSIVEQFTITGSLTGDNSMEIVLSWDKTEVKIPVKY